MKVAVIFLGAPGSGKGTQSRHLMQKHSIPVLGMGDLLRKESKKNNETSRYLSKLLEKGEIIPWSLTRQIFENNIHRLFQKSIVILDGVPRNVEQARDIDQILSNEGFDQVKVIYLDVSISTIQHRLSHRLVCMNCQAPFLMKTLWHVLFVHIQKHRSDQMTISILFKIALMRIKRA